ncbi:MAG: alpha-amylase [Lachnospiraceae bacterium]|nr:alpha-amylase [Lachnospiraceae bacterium]
MTGNVINQQNHKMGSGFPLGALPVRNGVMFTTSIPFRKTLELFIYNDRRDVIDRIDMRSYETSCGVYSCIVETAWEDGYGYCYEADGVKVFDPYIMNTNDTRDFPSGSGPVISAVYKNDFDWEDDRLPHHPYNDIISYQLHVRGFTAHSSSKVRNKGRFSGIVEKIPYLKDLGINQIVLMPSYEFDEVIRQSKPVSMDTIDYKTDPNRPNTSRVNFWGFANGCYFMPKAAFSAGDPVNEFKNMVKMLHKAGIEVIMRFYFPDAVNPSMIPHILGFWAREYHVDGFFLMGVNIPMDMIAADIYLRDMKIYGVFFDKESITRRKYVCNRNMAYVNPDFMNTCRKFLKSDENMLSDFLYRQRLNPADVHVINYISDYNAFTLNDLVSYDYKHNEDNNEDNNDGENFNYSWNCGVEGPTRKKSIMLLRTRQIRNALVFLLLAQGTPMLNAGDEFLNTQNGNNNPYCQDNETGWVVWKDNVQSRTVFEFTKMLIKLRMSHPVLHPEREFRLMDYAACGFPDLSYHGDMAWNARFDNHLRHVGIMICGKYARLSHTREDDSFYIAYNMHWEDHTFALPKLEKGYSWEVLFYTCDDHSAGIIRSSLSKGADSVTVPDRTVVVLTSVRDTGDNIKETKEKRRV